MLFQAVLEIKENKLHTPLNFFSWRCQFGGLNPGVSWNHPHGGGHANSPQFHQPWCSPHSTADPSNGLTAPMSQTGGTGNRSGKASFSKPTCPGCCFPLLLAQQGRNTANPGHRVGHWQPPTMSLPLTLWCLYHARHLLTFQCSLHLYFPKKHPDQNYHLSNLNYF